jgi:hypothetical protein
MRRIKSAALTLPAILLIAIDASVVSADIIQYSVTGTIDTNQDTNLYPGISVGDPFSGFFAYDDSIVGNKNPFFGLYQFHHTSSLLGVSFTVGGLTFQGDPAQGYSPQLFDNFPTNDALLYLQKAVPLSGHEGTNFRLDAEFEAASTMFDFEAGEDVFLPSTMQLGDWTERKRLRFGVVSGTGVITQFLSGTIGDMQLMMTGGGGDYNMDGNVDAADADLQSAAMKAPSPDLGLYDENGDGLVDYADRIIWVHDHAITWVGDSNLDDEFGSGDLVSVFAAGKYEIGQMASWAQGDWDGNMLFDSSDLVAAFADGGYEQGPRPAPMLVPEPSGVTLLLACAAGFFWRLRKRLR